MLENDLPDALKMQEARKRDKAKKKQKKARGLRKDLYDREEECSAISLPRSACSRSVQVSTDTALRCCGSNGVKQVQDPDSIEDTCLCTDVAISHCYPTSTL